MLLLALINLRLVVVQPALNDPLDDFWNCRGVDPFELVELEKDEIRERDKRAISWRVLVAGVSHLMICIVAV